MTGTDRGTLPGALVRNAVQTWGDTGRRWLDELPQRLAAVTDSWGVRIGAPYPMTFHWVAQATAADGTPAVIKLGVPDDRHLDREIEAMRAYGGAGAARLLAADPDAGALLLERAVPGTPLRRLVPHSDAEATAALLGVAARLHRAPPPGHRLPHLAGYGAALTDHLRRHPGDRPLPRHLVSTAAGLFAELCADAPEPVLLHGDLHHDNVLAAGRQPWLAIDPHGLVGDPAYDTAAMLYNPDPQRHDQRLLALVPARIEQLAHATGTAPERITAWGFVQAALSEVWTAQGSGTPGSRALDVARLLEPRLP